MLPWKPEKPDELTKKTGKVCRNACKRIAAGSVENVITNKSMRLSNDFNPSHRLSMRLDVGKGPSRASSRLNDCLRQDTKTFPSLEGLLEIQRDWQLNIETDDPRNITFLKHEIRGVYNE